MFSVEALPVWFQPVYYFNISFVFKVSIWEKKRWKQKQQRYLTQHTYLSYVPQPMSSVKLHPTYWLKRLRCTEAYKFINF